MHSGNERSGILYQTCNKKAAGLSMYDILLPPGIS